MWHRGPPDEDSLWLWNPHQVAGHPYLATLLNGVLYPPAWLARLLPTPAAIEALSVFHIAAAGIFTFLYARAIALGTVAALLAAIGFMCSGFVGGEAAWFPPAIGSAVWLPLGMLAIERLFATQRIAWSVPLAIAIGMPVLSGWVQSWVYSLYVLGGYTALRIALDYRETREAGRTAKLASFAAFGAVAGVALAAWQLVPSLELMSLGPRRPGSLSVSRILVIGPTSPIELLRQATDGSPGFGRYAYVGLAALVLAPLACFVRRDRFRALFLAAIAGFALLVVGASSSDWFELYLYFPGGGLFRKPQRILYLWAFAMSVLSGIGLDSLRKKSALSEPAQLLLLAAMGAAVIGSAWLADSLRLRSAVCLLVSLGAAASLILRGGRVRTLASIVLLAAVLVDLVGALRNPYLHPIHETTEIDRASGVFAYVKRHQGFDRSYLHDETFLHYDLMPKQGTLRGLYLVRDYEPLSRRAHKDFFAAIEGDRERKTGILTFTGRLIADPTKDSFRMLDLMSVRYAVAREGSAFAAALSRRGGWRLVDFDEAGPFRLFEREEVLPRAYLSERIQLVATPEEALRIVSGPSFDPWREVVIEGDGPTSPGRPATPIVPARIVSYEPERVVVDVVAERPGHLVLTDSDYPGWEARVDGELIEIERANGLFRAVPVDPGQHQVVFEFRPLSIRIGAALSLTSGVLLVSLVVYDRRSRRDGVENAKRSSAEPPSGKIT
jgi:hypothetical protein